MSCFIFIKIFVIIYIYKIKKKKYIRIVQESEVCAMYYYWILDKETGEQDNFVDDIFYDIGTEIKINGIIYTIVDIAPAENKLVSCEDLKEWY